MTVEKGQWTVDSGCERNLYRGLRAAILFFLTSYIICLPSIVRAQDVTATLRADSSHILIGDFLKIQLTVKSPGDINVLMPPIADTVGNMEVVKISKIDTSISGNNKTLSQTYIVSAYDSGKYHAGPQKIYYKSKNGIVDSVLSDSILVSVTTVPVDTAKAFKPIKAPLSVPYSWVEFLPYILGAVVLITVATLVIFYLSSRKKRKTVVKERSKPKDPAHVWARKELKKLEEERLWQRDEIKQYYSRLTDILRLYLEYRYNWLALESTTEEITDEIASYEIPLEARSNLLSILNEGDLVKFAKKIPMPDTNLKVMDQAYRFIDLTELKVEEKVPANV